MDTQEGGRTATSEGRGFAKMDAHRRREIASQGGHAAHEKGTGHEFTPEEAREAGRKGGQAVSRDRAHMARIGRQGGLRAHAKRAESATKGDSPEAKPEPQSVDIDKVT